MWIHYTGLSERAQGTCIREAGIEKEIRQEKQGRRCYAAGFEGSGRGHKLKECRHPGCDWVGNWKEQEIDFTLEPPEVQPCLTPDLDQ